MDVGTTNGWRLDDVVPAAEILELIGAQLPLEPLAPTYDGEVASRYRYSDGSGEIGLIHAVTAALLRHGCTRARLSAEGRLFTCLFAAEGHDLRALLRSGADDEELRPCPRAGVVAAHRPLLGAAGRGERRRCGPGPRRDVLYRRLTRRPRRRRSVQAPRPGAPRRLPHRRPAETAATDPRPDSLIAPSSTAEAATSTAESASAAGRSVANWS